MRPWVQILQAQVQEHVSVIPVIPGQDGVGRQRQEEPETVMGCGPYRKGMALLQSVLNKPKPVRSFFPV